MLGRVADGEDEGEPELAPILRVHAREPSHLPRLSSIVTRALSASFSGTVRMREEREREAAREARSSKNTCVCAYVIWLAG